MSTMTSVTPTQKLDASQILENYRASYNDQVVVDLIEWALDEKKKRSDRSKEYAAKQRAILKAAKAAGITA